MAVLEVVRADWILAVLLRYNQMQYNFKVLRRMQGEVLEMVNFSGGFLPTGTSIWMVVHGQYSLHLVPTCSLFLSLSLSLSPFALESRATSFVRSLLRYRHHIGKTTWREKKIPEEAPLLQPSAVESVFQFRHQKMSGQVISAIVTAWLPLCV
jgi:hypothetical protein